MTTITNRPGITPFAPTADVSGSATVNAKISVNVNVTITVGSGFDAPLRVPQDRNCWTCFPKPAPEQSSPPAGKGLGKAPEFGPNAIKTAGGYVIVPQGKDQAWHIYAPGQKPGEKPNTRIWGDPHVYEADGTKWDFTKNSSFRLPDGTNIVCNTTAQTGQSVTKSLDITNGADRVQIEGIDTGKVKVGNITHDGYAARAKVNTQDTFHLGGDAKGSVKWYRERDGKMDGEVIGASLISKNGEKYYEQKVDGKSQYVVDPALQPKVGTAAWGNKLRSEAVDLARKIFGADSLGANVTALGAQVDHRQNTWQGRLETFFSQLQNLMSLFSMWSAKDQVQPNRPVVVR